MKISGNGEIILDEALLNKVAVIMRSLERIMEDYHGYEDELEINFTRQDAIVLNVQRACKASLDAAVHLIRMHHLGTPQESTEVFAMLARAGIIDDHLAERMQALAGFHNIVGDDYRSVSLAVLRAILENHLEDFHRFAQAVLNGNKV